MTSGLSISTTEIQSSAVYFRVTWTSAVDLIFPVKLSPSFGRKISTVFVEYRQHIKCGKTQTAVINIVNKRILIKLTFRMLDNIHFQKYPLQCLKTVYIVYNEGLEPS